MKRLTYIAAIIALTATAATLTSCIQDSVIDNALTETIGFNTTTSAATKGSVVEGTSSHLIILSSPSTPSRAPLLS